MKFVDTHCHLDFQVRKSVEGNHYTLFTPEEIEAVGTVVNQASELGVTKLVTIGTTLLESLNAVRLAYAYAQVWASVGVHPNSVHNDWKKDLAELKELIARDEKQRIVAVGEAGIDLYWKTDDLEDQKRLFRGQIELALESGLPLVIHVRDQLGVSRAIEIVFDILDEYDNALSAVIHCFQQNKDAAQEAVKRGFLLGIDAPVGYPKNEWLRSAVASVPLESLVLETDAPFLPPPTMRGKPNGQYALAYIAQVVAQIYGVSIETVADQTTRTAEGFFRKI